MRSLLIRLKADGWTESSGSPRLFYSPIRSMNCRLLKEAKGVPNVSRRFVMVSPFLIMNDVRSISSKWFKGETEIMRELGKLLPPPWKVSTKCFAYL